MIRKLLCALSHILEISKRMGKFSISIPARTIILMLIIDLLSNKAKLKTVGKEEKYA